jgi:hypothetical protein
VFAQGRARHRTLRIVAVFVVAAARRAVVVPVGVIQRGFRRGFGAFGRGRFCALRFGLGGMGRRFCGNLALLVLVLAFQQRVVLQHLLQFLVQLQRRQLQQPDRLLQLRRQGEVLTELELETVFHES